MTPPQEEDFAALLKEFEGKDSRRAGPEVRAPGNETPAGPGGQAGWSQGPDAPPAVEHYELRQQR